MAGVMAGAALSVDYILTIAVGTASGVEQITSAKGFEFIKPYYVYVCIILIALLTGVEAVSNAVPNFKEPSTKYAKKVLVLLSLIVWVLSLASIVLIIIFKANVSSLLGLFAIGVFISFTLSQFGMFLKWIRERGENWVFKASVYRLNWRNL